MMDVSASENRCVAVRTGVGWGSMNRQQRIMMRTLISGVLISVVCSRATAQITLDYTHDTFFAGNATARMALEQAVADINGLITTTLNPITMDVVNGNSGGGTSLNFDFSYSYTNPTTGAGVTVNNTALPGSMTIFAGMRPLTGTTLGQAGPGGSGVSVTGTVGGGSIAAAIAAAESAYEHGRGGGPIITTLASDISGNPYSFDMGARYGHVWFDNDTNNDTLIDTPAQLAANWHFDHTTAVAFGKDDFYSVALHEVLHTVGYGAGESWDSLVSGTNWTGANAIAEHGTGTGIIDGDGSHLVPGLMSTRLSDGMTQEVVMDPNLTTGTRKSLTAFDGAILADIGWDVAAVPEPSSFLLLSLGAAAVGYRRRRVA